MITFKSQESTRHILNPRVESKPVFAPKIFVAGAENTLANVLTYGLYEQGAQISAQTVNHDSAIALKRNFPILHCSLTDERFTHALATFSPDVILHAPAEPTRESSSHWPWAVFNRIVERTLAVCEAARRHSPTSHVVFLSSAEVYGECDSPAKEDRAPAPVTVQGRYTHIAEQVLRDFHETHGLKTTILRVSSAYGPSLRNNPVNDLLFNLIGPQGTNGKADLNMNATCDLIHGADVVQAVRLILEKSTEGTFNVGSGTCLSLADLNTHLCAILELSPEPAYAKPTVTNTLAQRVDISKLKALGFVSQVPLLEGLRGYAAWWSGAKAA